MASSKKIRLQSVDGQMFEVDEVVASQSETIRQMIDDEAAGDVIQLPNVSGKILAKVIDYCKKHSQYPKPSSDDRQVDDASSDEPEVDEALKKFDSEFLTGEQAIFFDLILAANYLNIKGLLDLTCRTVAGMITGKTPEEIRNTFNIKNDFTPDQEEEVRRENQWSFE